MRSAAQPRLSGGDSGFTLVELIVAILIIGVITVPLANVVVGYLRNADETTGRLLESHDVQISSAYWAQDVSSIGVRSAAPKYTLNQSVETDVAYDKGLYPCGPAGTPNAIARLAWDDFNGPGAATVVRVAYVVEQSTELHRLRCNGSATVVSDVTLAHDLDPLTPPPVVACDTSCTGVAPVPAVPQTVTLPLTLRDPGNPDKSYVVRLTGQRRQSS